MSGALVRADELVAFLEKYVELKYNFSAACRAIGRHYTTIYNHLRENKEFREAFELTKGTMGDALLAEAYRRAVEGVTSTRYTKDGQSYDVTEYSDTLLAQLLRALRPEFREKSTLELTGEGGGPVEVNDTTLATKLASIIAVARERQRRGEVIEGEIVEPEKLPASPDNSDLL